MVTISESGKTKYGVQEGFVLNKGDLEKLDKNKIAEGSIYLDIETQDVYVLMKENKQLVWKTI